MGATAPTGPLRTAPNPTVSARGVDEGSELRRSAHCVIIIIVRRFLVAYQCWRMIGDDTNSCCGFSDHGLSGKTVNLSQTLGRELALCHRTKMCTVPCAYLALLCVHLNELAVVPYHRTIVITVIIANNIPPPLRPILCKKKSSMRIRLHMPYRCNQFQGDFIRNIDP